MAKAIKRRPRDDEDEVYDRPRPKKGKPSHTEHTLKTPTMQKRTIPAIWRASPFSPPSHPRLGRARLSVLREFLRTTKAQAKKQVAAGHNGNLADFQKVVETRKMELRKLLQDKAREVHEHDAQLRQSLVFALRDGLAGEANHNSSLVGQNGGQDPLFQKATALLTASKTLLHSYTHLSEQVTLAERQLTIPQEVDTEYTRLETIIETRGKWVGAQVQLRLLAKGEGNHEAQPSPASYEIWTRFGGSTVEAGGAQGEGEAWAQAAKQARRGVRRLVRHLSDDEGGAEMGRGMLGEKVKKGAGRGVRRG